MGSDKYLINLSQANSNLLLILIKEEIRSLIGLLTGHGLVHHLKVESVQEGVCKFYCEEIETAENPLLNCGAVADKKRRLGDNTWFWQRLGS